MRTRITFLAFVVAGVTLLVPAAASAQELPMCDPTTIETIFPDPEPDDRLPFAPLPDLIDHPEDGPRQIDFVVKQENCSPFVYDMLSPYGQQPTIISEFAADRPNGRLHKGADISNPKMTPVYAVSEGFVTWILDEREGDCCALAIRHPDGWTSYYIHLNNDTFGTDDGLGYGIAPGLTLDSTVEAGQLIGWVGDSGNAEETPPHVHFELRMPGNAPVDPAASLQAATRATTIETSANRDFVLPFADDDGTYLEPVLGRLASLGIITGCGDPDGTAFCANDPLTQADAVELIAAFTGVTVDPDAVLAPTTPADIPKLDETSTVARCEASHCAATTLTGADVEALLDAAFSTGDAEHIAELGELPKLLLGRCEDVVSETLTTRGDLVVYLAEQTGLVTTVPCGMLR